MQDTSAPVWLVAFLAFVVICFFSYILAFVVFLSFLLTIPTLIGAVWGLDVGSMKMEPNDGIALFVLGVVGALIVPAFLYFCDVFIEAPVPWRLLHQYILGGYAAGLFGGWVLFFWANRPSSSSVYTNYSHQSLENRQPEYLPPKSEPYRYATWDDEEKRR